MADDIPTTDQIRAWCADDGGLAEYHDPINGHRQAGETLKRFDAWLAAHDAEVAYTIATRIRQNCTVPTDALNKAGDYIVYAVADWIENPPEWVNAPWRSPLSADAGTEGA